MQGRCALAKKTKIENFYVDWSLRGACVSMCQRLHEKRDPSPHVSASLLERLIQRSGKPTMQHKGSWGWVYLEAREWYGDAGLSVKQYYDSVTFLCKNGCLLREYKHSGQGKGSNTFLKINPMLIKIFEKHYNLKILLSYEINDLTNYPNRGVVPDQLTKLRRSNVLELPKRGSPQKLVNKGI